MILTQNGCLTKHLLPEFGLTYLYATYVWVQFARVFIPMPHNYKQVKVCDWVNHIVHNIVSA